MPEQLLRYWKYLHVSQVLKDLVVILLVLAFTVLIAL